MSQGSSFYQLAVKQAEIFQKDNVAWMGAMVTSSCIKSIMCYAYGGLVRDGKIKPIEDMTLDEKTNLWNQAKEFSNGQLDQSGLVQVAKTLITLEFLLNQ